MCLTHLDFSISSKEIFNTSNRRESGADTRGDQWAETRTRILLGWKRVWGGGWKEDKVTEVPIFTQLCEMTQHGWFRVC